MKSIRQQFSNNKQQPRKLVPYSAAAMAKVEKAAMQGNITPSKLLSMMNNNPNLVPNKLKPALRVVNLATQVPGLSNVLDAEFTSIIQPVNNKVKQAVGNAARAFKGVNTPSENINPANDSYALCKAPNPKKVVLNSKIQPNVWANDLMAQANNLCSPLHLTFVKLGIPTSSTNPLNAYFNTIAYHIQTRAQSNVGFDLQVQTQMTQAQILAAFNAAIYALQVYFWYTSILSSQSESRNKNEGMIALRGLITPQIMSDLNQLQSRLEDTPFPPRFVEWVRYMSNNYYSGDSQGASILKIGFHPDSVLAPPTTTFPAQALAGLQTPANITVFSLMRRAIPQWRISALYDVPPLPVFDKSFLTIFANLPSGFYSTGTTQVYAKTVTTTSQTVSYNSFSNRLDGLAYAMCSVRNSTSSQFEPGLVDVPFAGDNRLSWYNTGGVPTWIYATANPFLTLSRQESSMWTTPLGTEYTPHLNGAEKCQGVSSNTLNQSACMTLDFLVNLDSIPAKGSLSSFNGTVRR